MNLPLFWKALVIGFSIAAPVGPIGVLCIRRVLTRGRLYGLVSGLGAASADAVYGGIAGLGLTGVSHWLLGFQGWLALLGGLFLCWLGFSIFNSRPPGEEIKPTSGGLGVAYASTLFYTLTNPMTILSFAAIFAGLGLVQTGGSLTAAAWVISGVFLGSASWWLLLSILAGLLRNRLNPSALGWINKIAGTVVFTFGFLSLLHAGGL